MDRRGFLLEVLSVRKILGMTFLLADEFCAIRVRDEDAVVWACQEPGQPGACQVQRVANLQLARLGSGTVVLTTPSVGHDDPLLKKRNVLLFPRTKRLESSFGTYVRKMICAVRADNAVRL